MREWKMALVALATLAPAAAWARSAACDVGAAQLAGMRENWTGPPPVIHRGPVGAIKVESRGSFSGKPDGVVSPPLFEAWNANQTHANLFDACPELQSLLPAGWRYATPEEEAMKLGGPSTWVTSFAEPLVMGDQALAYWSAQCPGLCAQMMVVLYRRGSKGWSAVGPAAIAMS